MDLREVLRCLRGVEGLGLLGERGGVGGLGLGKGEGERGRLGPGPTTIVSTRKKDFCVGKE